jgi:hypothetical protein
MDNDFLKILRTALSCPTENIEEYLIEEQIKSSLSPKIFFGILLKEIQNQENEVNSKQLFEDLLRPYGWPHTRNGELDSRFFEEKKISFVYHQSLGLLKNIIKALIEKSKYSTKSSTKGQNRPTTLIFDSNIKDQLFSGLKPYFKDKEVELEILLSGGIIDEKLVWPLNQNQLSDLFLRLKDNGYITNNKTEIKKWLINNFTLVSGDLNPNSIYETLTMKSPAGKTNRILENLAPFKPKTK